MYLKYLSCYLALYLDFLHVLTCPKVSKAKICQLIPMELTFSRKRQNSWYKLFLNMIIKKIKPPSSWQSLRIPLNLPACGHMVHLADHCFLALVSLAEIASFDSVGSALLGSLPIGLALYRTVRDSILALESLQALGCVCHSQSFHFYWVK